MTLNVQSVYDNPATPGDFAQAYFPDQLIAGGTTYITQPIVLASGNYPRGTVLGQQTGFSIYATPNAGNTGNGTVGSYVYEADREYGNFVVAFTDATHYAVTDPEGNAIGNGTTGVAFVGSYEGGPEIGFTITAGGTAFVAGDGFVITQSQSTGNYIICVKTASDGSQVPSAILADNANATAGPVNAGVFVFGEFNQNALNFDSSWNLAQLVQAMRPNGLYAKYVVSAADPIGG